MNDAPWTPQKLLQTSGFYWKTCTLHAGVALGIFSHIGSSQVDAGSLAQSLSLDEDAASRLLDALSAMGLLVKENQLFSNSPEAARFLVKDAPGYLGHMIMHHHHLMPSWSQLSEAIRTGEPGRNRASFADETQRESFLMGMYNSASQLAPEIVKRVNLEGRARLLDFGGGPGTFAAHFCQANAGLQAVVLDLPTTRVFAERIIAQFGLADRVRFFAGDYLDDDLDLPPGPFDAIWMSHVLHGEGYQDCGKMIRRATALLAPGGVLLIHEFILTESRDEPLFAALFSLNMLLGTPSGRSYTQEELTAMMTDAGLVQISRIPFDSPTESGILSGTRQ
jgi:predicted O-methyltransferase YrrM